MFKKAFFLLFSLFVFVFSVTLMAETITLTTGDLIEGTIINMDSSGVKVEDVNGVILEIKRELIASIDYDSNEKAYTVSEQPVNIQKTYEPVPPVPVSPINTQPAYYFDNVPYESGLLDPELEARRRLVSYNEQKKNPLLATSLSVVFPGTGHFYSNKIAAGFFFLGTRAIFAGMTWYGFTTRTDPNTSITTYRDFLVGSAGAAGFITMAIIEAIDSYSTASDFNDNLRLKLGIDTLHENVVPVFEN